VRRTFDFVHRVTNCHRQAYALHDHQIRQVVTQVSNLGFLDPGFFKISSYAGISAVAFRKQIPRPSPSCGAVAQRFPAR